MGIAEKIYHNVRELYDALLVTAWCQPDIDELLERAFAITGRFYGLPVGIVRNTYEDIKREVTDELSRMGSNAKTD